MLKVLQPGGLPIGQYDGLDTEFLTLLGGEVVSFTSIAKSASDLTALGGASDGYIWSNKRPVVTRNIDGYQRPLMLADDGTTGYGTMFGSVVGGTVGQNTTGTVLGPHTSTGSGKVTLWHQPGLYAVSLDGACDQAADGLVPTNQTLVNGGTGSRLTYVPSSSTVGGRLTPVGSTAAGGNTTVVGHFVDFETSESLVTTPNYLVTALAGSTTYKFAVFHFNPVS